MNKHSYTTNDTAILGGTSWISVTYYENATTLCDGHARVTYSPAIPISSTVITSVGTAPKTSTGVASMGWIFPVSSVSCSINPSDCDGLYKAYSTASSEWVAAGNGTRAVDAIFPTITPSPSLPACVNSSQSSSNDAFSKSFYGCGICTIFGDEVELMYFPAATTVSRDMCATTPSAKVTAYGKDVGVPYTAADPSATWNGTGPPPETAVVGSHTFTSGTAYISIKRVWAVDRCSSQLGSTVTGAVLALPSESLLSLRYSQNHFQYFATTNKVTGYPFNYADLNHPVPYSAWNGQARCEQPGFADYKCNVIYENDYNPQLAMPPGIRKLNPEWEGCQMWYGGLYDPPYALKPGTAVDTPTVAFGTPTATTTSAVEASSVAPTTPTPTALADHTTERAGTTQGQGDNGDTQRTQEAQETQVVSTAGLNQNTQATQTQDGTQNTGAAQNSQGGSQNNNGGNSQGGNNNNNQNNGGSQNTQGGVNNNNGGAQNTQASQNEQGGQNTQGGQNNQGQSQIGGQGQHWNPTQAGTGNTQGANTANEGQNTASSQVQGGSANPSAKPQVYVFTAGTFTYTATKTEVATNTVYVCGTDTLSVGGPAVTLPVNCLISAGTNGLVINTEAATITNRASAVTALPVITKAVIVTVGNKAQTFSQDSSGVVNIGSTKLTVGGSAATLDDGSVVSADSEGVKIGSTVVRYSTVAPASVAGSNVIVFMVGTKTVTASCPPGSTNQAVIGSVTLTAGGPVQTLEDGSHVSLASGGAIVVDGTSAAAITTPTSAVVFTVNGNAVTAYQAADVSSVATIDGTVVSRGGPAITLSSGAVVSVGSNGLVVQQGSTVVPVSAFTTASGGDGSTPSSGTSASGSGSDASSKNAVTGSTGTAQQNQGSQATTTSKSGAASITRLSATTSIVTTALLISPLLLAIFL